MAAALAIVVVAASWLWVSSQGVSTPAPSREEILAAANEPAPAAASADPRRDEPARTPAIVVRGTLRGRVVGPDDAPLGEATVSFGIDELDAAQLATATTGGDGQFWLPAPAGPLALRIGAAGFAAMRLGGLAPERAKGQDLDLGTLRLATAVTYRGQVRANGRGLADADVALRPVRGAPGSPTAVVLQQRTDGDGWFVFPQAAPPPICLHVEVPGYFSVTRRLERESTALQVDLDLVPRVQGRVVDADTGAPLADARVSVDGHGQTVRHSLETPSETRVHADGTFSLELRVPKFSVGARAEGYLPTKQGPFVSTAVPNSLVMSLERGCVVVGTVTWRGRGVRVQAGLWDREDVPAKAFADRVAEGEVLRLPAVRPGRWLLRVRTDHTAEHREWLDLRTLGEHRVAITLADGPRLVGSVLGRCDPGSVVMVEQIGGEPDLFPGPRSAWQRRRFGAVGGDGGFEVTGLCAGSWRAFVVVRGRSFADDAGHHLADLIGGGECFDLAAGEQDRRMDLPSLSPTVGRLRGQCATRDAGADVRLLATDGTQEQLRWELRTTKVASDGAFVLDPVPPGAWRVEVRLPGGSPREQTVTITAGAETACVFPD